MGNAGKDYVDAPAVLSQFIQNYAVPRTNLPLASSQGDITFFTKRVDYETKLASSLPAILVDINSLRPVHIIGQGGTSRKRGIPLVICVFTPVYAFLEGRTVTQIEEDMTVADDDIKTMYGDIESMLNTSTGRGLFHELELIDSPGIEHDIISFDAQMHLRARVAEMWCVAWRAIRN